MLASKYHGRSPSEPAHFVLRNVETGATIAEIELPGATGAKPMTYLLDGRQYIVVSVGQPGAAELVALALP